ncbi:MarR family transcriptional regulator [Sorangium sp. So ce388]|uniref:MarR family transcriptional regulator n=1 Tax=Sorangium sp. So ce388 TaxID=3133309 RepID=UPI003F5BE65B
MSAAVTRKVALDFLAIQDPDRLWTAAEVEKATGLDRYDVSRELVAASDEGLVDRYPPTDARSAAYAMGADQRNRWPS